MVGNNQLANFAILYSALLLFFAVGGITTLGLDWYAQLAIPAWAPPQMAVAVIWCTLFLLAALSACVCWNEARPDQKRATMLLYMGNAMLVLLWNYLFFGIHVLAFSLDTAILVGISILALIAKTRSISRLAAWLLVPYLLWVAFAIWLTYTITAMNI